MTIKPCSLSSATEEAHNDRSDAQAARRRQRGLPQGGNAVTSSSSHPESAWRRHWYLGVFDTGRLLPVANPREDPKSPAPSSHAMAALSFCRPPEICGRPRPFEIPLQNRRKPFMVWSKVLKVKAQYNLNVPKVFLRFSVANRAANSYSCEGGSCVTSRRSSVRAGYRPPLKQ